MRRMADILILAAHPDLDHSRVHRAMLKALNAAASPHIAVRDLYRRYPDYNIDVASEQRALASARLLVLLHPLYWYGMPALQKLWFDEVLRFGWAYGPGQQALAGKDLWLATSTGGTAESYSASGENGYPIDAFLLPYAQSARLCGMNFLPPLLLHAAHRVADAELVRHAEGFAQRLLDYAANRDAAAPGQAVPPAAPDIPLDARPALFSPLPEARR